MMFLLFFVPILGLLCLPSASGCTFVAKNTSINATRCLDSQYVRVVGRNVPLGTHEMRIQLEEPTREVSLYCGKFSVTYSWKYAKKDGNQIRVSFLQGFVHVYVYWCDNFDGPEQAGIRCVVEAFSTACPGRVDRKHTCVYEVVTEHFSGASVRDAVEVTAEVAVRVREKAGGSFGLPNTQENTILKTHLDGDRSYIIIPAGYRFCSYSEVISEENDCTATGFIWSCKRPTFVQTNKIGGRCTDLSLCENKSPCSASDNQPSCIGAKSAMAQPVAMLFALCMIVYVVGR
jgi:hypothetical protein